jgi:O-antigen ligase
VNAGAMASPINLVTRLWRDPAAWATAADVFAVLTALALPWSTTLTSIFVLCWLATAAWTLDYNVYFQSLKRPICALPIALFALAAVGTLWSDAPWAARLYAIGPAAKLLVLPGLFYHFERSARGMWVFAAFLASCALLMAMSWMVALHPGLALKPDAQYGVPVKNYIDQSQEFALCAVALAYPIVALLRTKRFLPAALLIAVSLSFVANMMLINVSRTALVTMPVMLAVFAVLHLRWRSTVIIFCATALLAGLAWTLSPHLRWTTTTFVRDYQIYKELNQPTSIGMRLEFWQKSLRFISESPVLGRGTGSIQALFEEAAVNQFGAAAQVVANPHNQTLNVAIQWGAAGVVVLYAMWLSHLLLFRGADLVAWIGLLVVVQNIFTSLFNSHLFDFSEGWMYVLGVGIAGGMVLRTRSDEAAAAPASSGKP